jgi:hypothetical protein
MSKFNKLLERLLSRPKDFTYLELKSLLNGFGYSESNKGKTSGSRVSFIKDDSKHVIMLHKPHPDNELKRYQIDLIIEELKEAGLIK